MGTTSVRVVRVYYGSRLTMDHRYLLQMREEEVKRAILVLRQQPTSFASQVGVGVRDVGWPRLFVSNPGCDEHNCRSSTG